MTNFVVKFYVVTKKENYIANNITISISNNLWRCCITFSFDKSWQGTIDLMSLAHSLHPHFHNP